MLCCSAPQATVAFGMGIDRACVRWVQGRGAGVRCQGQGTMGSRRKGKYVLGCLNNINCTHTDMCFSLCALRCHAQPKCAHTALPAYYLPFFTLPLFISVNWRQANEMCLALLILVQAT